MYIILKRFESWECQTYDKFVALIRAVDLERNNLLGAGVFSDSLGAFTHSVLRQFSRQQKPDSSLDFPGSDCWAFIVVSQTRCLSSDTLKDIVDKAIHYAHSFAGYSGIWMYLLQYFIDVNSVTFLPLPLLLLISLADVLLSLSGLLHSFAACFRWHSSSFRKAPYKQSSRRNFKKWQKERNVMIIYSRTTVAPHQS